MTQTNYTVERVLQLIRSSFNEQAGDLSAKVFFQRLWRKLEELNDLGIVRPPQHQQHLGQSYQYGQSPHELQLAAFQGFYYLQNSGYVYPKPTFAHPVPCDGRRYAASDVTL